MKKSIKIAAFAAAAAVLAIGAFMTSLAASKGWTQEDGEWVWLDSNGDKATSTFKQSGSTYYWLNDDGYLGSDELVEYNDNYYYVDEKGAMIKNQWKEVENNGDADGFNDTIWYYFQSSGKAYKSGKKSINGTSYIFDDKGRMLFGWIKNSGSDYSMGSKDSNSEDWKDCDYYAEENGALVTKAWKCLSVYEGSTPSLRANDAQAGDYDYWFYFGSNGKKYKMSDNDAGEGYTAKSIDGTKYSFAADGHMVTGWVDENVGASTVEYYTNPTSGEVYTKGWFKAVPSNAIDSNKSEEGDNEEQWFYADNSGKLVRSQIKSINGKKYLFNNRGELQTGLFYLWLTSDGVVIDMVKLNGDSFTEEQLDSYTLDKVGDSPYIAEVPHSDEHIEKGEEPTQAAETETQPAETETEPAETETQTETQPTESQTEESPTEESSTEESTTYDKELDPEHRYTPVPSVDPTTASIDIVSDYAANLSMAAVYEENKPVTVQAEASTEDVSAAAASITTSTTTATASSSRIAGKGDSDIDPDKSGVYYFAPPVDTDAAMKTGTVNVEVDGNNYTFKFATSGTAKGRGIDGVESNSVYINGRKIKADSDQKFVIYEISSYDYSTKSAGTLKTIKLTNPKYTASDVVGKSGAEDKAYAVISSTGTLVKSGTKTDGDGYKLEVSNYVLKKITEGSTKDVVWKSGLFE